jgi:hypothetical protein
MAAMNKIVILFAVFGAGGLASCTFSSSVSEPKTYESNKYGYHIQYPADWDISGAGQNKIKDNRPDLLEGNFVFFIKKGRGAVTIKVWPNPRHAAPKDWYDHDAATVMGEAAAGTFPYPRAMVVGLDETSVNHLPAYKITTTDGNFDYIFCRPEYAYVINFEKGDNNTDPAALENTFNGFLSSFRLNE